MRSVGRFRAAQIFFLQLGALFAGCGGEEAAPSRPAVTLAAGEWSVRADPERTSVALLRGETVLLDFLADGLELGVLPTVDDATNYDPWAIVAPTALHPTPVELSWLRVESVGVQEATDAALALRLSYGGGNTASLRIEPQAEGRFLAKLVPDAGAARVAYLRLRPRADAKEGFYGLGEHFDDVNQRGKVRAMQLEIDPELESSYNEVHVPIPFLVGTRGWGLFVESPYPAVFSVATEADDLVDAIFGTGTASKEGLTFHLFGAAHPLDVTRHYYAVTGAPALPARWALGPWVWRDENKDQAEVEADLATMRALDLPATGYWLDNPYSTAVNTFDFDPVSYPAPQAMIDQMHALGFRTALWQVPYLDEKDPATKPLRDEALAGGYYPPEVGLSINPWGKLIDLTNPDAYAWWQGLIENYTSMGVEGFKLDYAEDVVPGLTALRNRWRFADGSDERTMHGRYQLFFHRVHAETMPAGGGFLLCRHATYGGQTNGIIIWPGDIDASFARHREKVEDASGSYLAVGGLPAAVVAGSSLGVSGFPFFGSDTGGYLHAPPDKELFTRWFEHTALTTVMQIGNNASTVAWEPDAVTGFDAEMLGWYRTYTRLHLRLFPYEWTYAERLLEDGRPIQRPLGLAYPELGIHPNDVYMFGDDLLVAPVVDRGVTKREVPLPPGRWLDWWTGQTYEGGETITVAAPLETLPLFLREGGIVPMLRPTIDTLAPTSMPDQVDSYATTPGPLWARVAPGEKRAFEVFDGTVIEAERAGGVITLSGKAGSEFTLGFVFEVPALGKAPASVTANGMALTEVGSLADLEKAPSGWVYGPEMGGTLHVKVGAGEQGVRVEW